MKISFGGGHDQASLVSSPGLNATGDAPCLSLRSGDEDSMPLKLFLGGRCQAVHLSATSPQGQQFLTSTEVSREITRVVKSCASHKSAKRPQD